MGRKLNTRKPLNRFAESKLLSIASNICRNSPGNILLIGGGNALSNVAGYKRLRPRSDDLDFIVNKRGYEYISRVYETTKAIDVKKDEIDSKAVLASVEEVPCAFFTEELRGYTLDEEDFTRSVETKTSYGTIYSIPPELNVALKIRRGASKGHVYGKDYLDFATIFLGLAHRGLSFDANLFNHYMRRGVCQTCQIEENQGCMKEIDTGTRQVRKRDRDLFVERVEALGREISEVCIK